MSTQTFVKKGKTYTAKLVLTSEADLSGSDYEVFVSVGHEWSSSLAPVARLLSPANPGDTELSVTDGSLYTAGDFVLFASGKTEHRVVDAVDENLVTLTAAIDGSHSLNTSLIKQSRATRDSALHYSYDFTAEELKSSGQYHIRWLYIRSGDVYTVDQYIMVYQPYITADEFFELHPEFESDWEDSFDNIERTIRNKINTYCGQAFDFYPNKTQIFDGNNGRVLDMGTRIANILQIVMLPETDLTNDIAISHDSNRFLSLKYRDNITMFSSKYEFEVTGDWGWESVPSNVTQAAELLMEEYFGEDSSLRKGGVKKVMMDSESIELLPGSQDSTGNIDADVLLLDYTIFIMGMV